MKKSNLVRDADGWETISSETYYANPHIEVVTTQVRTPSHPEARFWTVAHRKGAVVVAPMTAEGKLVLIRQERIPVRAALWEVPAGQIDDTLEPDAARINEVALQELGEETGYELAPGGKLVPMGHYFSSPGFTDEHGYFFLARPVQPRPSGHAHDETESILDCREFTMEAFRQMIAEGEIRDANTLSIFAKLVACDLLPGSPKTKTQ